MSMTTELYYIDLINLWFRINLTLFKTRWYFSIYIEEIFCEKRNASTPLGIEPRTFRLPVECSIIWATVVPHNFSHRIYLRLMWLRINRELFSDFSKSDSKIYLRFPSSDDRAFDRQSKNPGLDTQWSGSIPFFTENFFEKLVISNRYKTSSIKYRRLFTEWKESFELFCCSIK